MVFHNFTKFQLLVVADHKAVFGFSTVKFVSVPIQLLTLNRAVGCLLALRTLKHFIGMFAALFALEH